MTKLRAANSIEDAVFQAIALLGMPRLTDITGKSPALIKAWSDPDDDQRSIPLRACAAIDRELAREGHEPLFVRWLQQAVAVAPRAMAASEDPRDAAVRVVTTAARALEETQAALANGALDPTERLRLKREIVTLRKRLAAFERSLAGSGRVGT
jgi:hypothetical protein